MSDGLRYYAFVNLDRKDTAELLAIWKKHDTSEWSELAFDVIADILESRQVELPPHDEPGAESAEREFSAEVDAITDVGELDSRIEEREIELRKVQGKKTAGLLTLVGGSASMICFTVRSSVEIGVYALILGGVTVALFAGLYAWRMSRYADQEAQLQSELTEYRDKRAQLEASLTAQE